MEILIAGGSGLVGSALIKYLLVQNIAKDKKYNITILGRKKNKLAHFVAHLCEFNPKFSKYLDYISWREIEHNPDNTVNIIAKFDLIVNLCGENIGDQRWSKKYKKKVLESRIKSTQLLADACVNVDKKYHKKISLYNASAIGAYGVFDQQTIFTEDAELGQPQDFSSKVVKQWEDAASIAVKNNIRVIFMRFGVVLDWHGGALAKMTLPFKFGLGGRVGSGNQPFSWIALADLIRIIEVIINNTEISGPINLVAPELITQYDLAQALAKHFNRPCFMPLPSFMVKLIFGQMGEELLLRGAKVSSNKLCQYYQDWQFPSIQKFFA